MPVRLAKRVGSGKFIWSGRIFRCKRGQTEYALRAVKKTESTKVAVLGASGYTGEELVRLLLRHPDRKSTRLNSSHSQISYAVFCLKKKKNRLSEIIRV